MSYGPVLVIDKSTFQSLSAEEYELASWIFLPVMPPVLAMEILGDLTKISTSKRRLNKPAPEKVKELAAKFCGDGPVVCVDYATACIENLGGNSIPMNGTVPVTHADTQRLPDGGTGAIIGPHPLNMAIMRWSDGTFREPEGVQSAKWRQAYAGMTLDSFRETLTRRRVISRTVKAPGDIRAAADALLDEASYQSVWVEWLLQQLDVPRRVQRGLTLRWELSGRPRLRHYAMFAAHCVRAMIALDIAVRSRLLTWEPSHIVDLQYLFYQAFCSVVTSNDHLHVLLSPVLMRKNQSFLLGTTLKAEVRALLVADLRMPPTHPWRADSHEWTRFEEIAPAVARLHREHLWGGVKEPHPTGSLD